MPHCSNRNECATEKLCNLLIKSGRAKECTNLVCIKNKIESVRNAIEKVGHTKRERDGAQTKVYSHANDADERRQKAVGKLN